LSTQCIYILLLLKHIAYTQCIYNNKAYHYTELYTMYI